MKTVHGMKEKSKTVSDTDKENSTTPETMAITKAAGKMVKSKDTVLCISKMEMLLTSENGRMKCSMGMG